LGEEDDVFGVVLDVFECLYEFCLVVVGGGCGGDCCLYFFV